MVAGVNFCSFSVIFIFSFFHYELKIFFQICCDKNFIWNIVMVLHIDWLGEENIIGKDMKSSTRAKERVPDCHQSSREGREAQ